MMSVTAWWMFLCCVATFNVGVWVYSARALAVRQPSLPRAVWDARRAQLLFSGLYVFGCAYRSFFVVYDVPRLCLIDSFFSSVLVGRSVATVAEMSFVAQWALLLRESARASGSVIGRGVSLLLVPLIAVAETCSWYSVLSTSNLGHVAEESIWGFAAALLVVSVAVLLPRTAPARRPVLAAWCAAGLAYVVFMYTVDVPMYWARWVADETAGRHYLTIAQGFGDVSHHRVVSFLWQDWKHEVVWMSLYFSVAVWLSLSLIRAPAPQARLRALQPKRLLAVKLGLP